LRLAPGERARIGGESVQQGQRQVSRLAQPEITARQPRPRLDKARLTFKKIVRADAAGV
jgi:hypothetical protein